MACRAHNSRLSSAWVGPYTHPGSLITSPTFNLFGNGVIDTRNSEKARITIRESSDCVYNPSLFCV